MGAACIIFIRNVSQLAACCEVCGYKVLRTRQREPITKRSAVYVCAYGTLLINKAPSRFECQCRVARLSLYLYYSIAMDKSKRQPITQCFKTLRKV